MFNHYAITPEHPGGTRHFELGRNLAGRGRRVVIFASNFIHMNFHFVEVNREGYRIEEFGNLRFTWLRTPGYRKNNWKRLLNTLVYSRRASRLARRLLAQGIIEKPDIIIGSTVHPFAALMASSLARELQVPFIFEIRDLWPQSFIDMGAWKEASWQSRMFAAIEKKTVSRARKIITLSPKTQSYLTERYGFPAGDIHYIPNGVKIITSPFTGGDKSQDQSQAITELRQMKRRSFIVLYSGSLIATNKLETIIDAAEMLRSHEKIELALIGRGQEEQRYRELIQGKNLENIRILPPVRKDEVPYLLKQAHLLILNQGNVQWGSSNKLYDYMASGRPVISSIHASHNDIIAEIGGGVSVTPENPWALSQAILRMWKMGSEQRTLMGDRNIKYVKEHHDWNILSDKLASALESTLDA
jgi:glycosyltransferase involved in cell wall biosynthesis